MSDAPPTLEAIAERLDLLKERIGQSQKTLERKMWIDAYKNNLRAMKDRMEGYLDLTIYAQYAIWYITMTDVEERKYEGKQ